MNAGSTTATRPSAHTMGVDSSIVPRTSRARRGSSEYSPLETPCRTQRTAPPSRAFSARSAATRCPPTASITA